MVEGGQMVSQIESAKEGSWETDCVTLDNRNDNGRNQILYGIRMSLHHLLITESLGMNFLLYDPDILEPISFGMLLPSDNDVFHLHLPCHFMLLT